jgi:hypothetical protein
MHSICHHFDMDDRHFGYKQKEFSKRTLNMTVAAGGNRI